MALPKFIVIKSFKTDKYLRINLDKSDSQTYTYLKFSAEEAMITSPFTKFQLEPAKSGDGLVHLKCCYNNKYLRRWSMNHLWIAAASGEPKEDRFQWNCTLFKPIIINTKAKTIRFLHVQSGRYAIAMETLSPNVAMKLNLNGMIRGQEYWLYVQSSVPDMNYFDVFTIADWESLVPPPPRQVAADDAPTVSDSIASKIYDVIYHFRNAKFSDQKVETLATATINNTTLESNIVAIELTYPNTKTSTWSSSKVFSTVALKTNIPTIVAGGLLENSTVFEGQYEWGKTKDFSNKVKLVFNTIVPRKAKFTLNLVGTLGSYDIPFSYTQCDTLTNGKQVVRGRNDGIYTRVNVFNLKYEMA